MTIQCFWVEPTGEGVRFLRRYAAAPFDGPCRGQHEAEVEIGRCAVARGEHAWVPAPEAATLVEDDPRWPATCSRGCGRPFEPRDGRQVGAYAVYARIDGVPGEFRAPLYDETEGLVGAMYDAWWRAWTRTPHAPADGICLQVVTPDGSWFVDGPAGNGDGWRRTGDPRAIPPTVTANPSIQIGGVGCGRYHGWLRNGQLVDA